MTCNERCEHTVRLLGRQYQCDDVCDGHHAEPLLNELLAKITKVKSLAEARSLAEVALAPPHHLCADHRGPPGDVVSVRYSVVQEADE